MKKCLSIIGIVIILLNPIVSYATDYSTMTLEELNTELELIQAEIKSRVAADYSDVSVGSIVTFGHYEQDGQVGNGKEQIEWIILDKKDGKVFLLGRYGLDSIPYNADYSGVTWEECSLRVWLNQIFLHEAFSTEEQASILLTIVNNDASQGYAKWDTSGGNATQDKLFLLSYAEANSYLGVEKNNIYNITSRIEPTAFAIQNGASVSDVDKDKEGNEAGWWWLRSPGVFQNSAGRVSSDGSLDYSFVDNEFGCVRPALWLDLSYDCFQIKTY